MYGGLGGLRGARWSGRVPKPIPEMDGAGGPEMRGLVDDFGVG